MSFDGGAVAARVPGLGRLVRQRDALQRDRDELLAQRDDLHARLAELHAGHANAKADIDRLNVHVDQLAHDYHDVLDQRSALYAERDLVTGQRDALQRRLDALVDEHHRVVRELQRVAPLVDDPRAYLADRFLRGDGIEIGALHRPTWVPDSAHVRYVDHLSTDDLRREYPELASVDLVEPSILDDGERLDTIESKSLNFIIANHFLEHCEDPIGTLATFRDRLRPDGVLFLAVPDMRHTFDHGRPLTTLEHLVADHMNGPEQSRLGHYQEYVRHVADLMGAEGEALVERLLKSKYSIHFHTFTAASLGRLYDHCQLELTASLRHQDEVVTVVRT